MNNIDIILIAEDFKGFNYSDNRNCPLAKAIKRLGLVKEPHVGGSFTRVIRENLNKVYTFSENWNYKIAEEQYNILRTDPNHTYTITLTKVD